MIMRPPMTHERMDAGPAMIDALRAPKSQPDPIMDPTPANRSPTGPMWPFSRVGAAGIYLDFPDTGSRDVTGRGPRHDGELGLATSRVAVRTLTESTAEVRPRRKTKLGGEDVPRWWFQAWR